MLKRLSKYTKIIIPLLTLFSLSFVYLGGFFSSKTDLEKISSYASKVVLNNTVNKERICITAERASSTGSLPDAETEFRNLYGVFAQRTITFSSVINPDKKHNITIGNGLTNNLSAMYVGPVGSTEYNGGYRHYVYPFDLMFPDDKDYEKKTKTRFYAYISQSQADKILDEILHEERVNGVFSLETYQKLILQEFPFTVDGELFDFGILNIFYETNYYYKGLTDAVGDFILTSYSFPKDLRKEQKHLYFLNSNDYQNKYFMEYLNTLYSTDDYLLKINPYNLIGTFNSDYLLSFHNVVLNNKLEWVSITLFTVAAIMLIFNIVLFAYNVFRNKNKKTLNLITYILLLFIPYIVFSILYLITMDAAYISDISSKINVIYICVYSVLLLVIHYSDRIFNVDKGPFLLSRGKDYYEVII